MMIAGLVLRIIMCIIVAAIIVLFSIVAIHSMFDHKKSEEFDSKKRKENKT